MAKKEPKEKKSKEKKPPKEKKPKVKKPPKEKKPKPKKEKAPKKKKADGAEGGKKGGKKTLVLVLVLVAVVAVAAVIAVFTLRSIGGGEDQTLEETESGEEGEETDSGEDSGDGEEGEDGEGDSEDADEAPAPSKAPDPLRVTTAMTTAETEEYLRRFTPASLGLSGESMEDYEIYAADNVVLVDGYTCAELSVYSKDASAGTNDIEGWFLLSRGSDRTLFRLDRESGQLTKLDPERSTDSG